MCKTARCIHALKTFLERGIGTISIWFVQINWRYPNILLFFENFRFIVFVPYIFYNSWSYNYTNARKKIDHNNYFIGCFSLRVSFVFSRFYSRSWKTSYNIFLTNTSNKTKSNNQLSLRAWNIIALKNSKKLTRTQKWWGNRALS